MDYMNYRHDSSWVMPYLGPGESILWQGRPQRFTPFTASDGYLIPFSIFWCSFLVRPLWSDLKEGFNVTTLFLIPFILAGLYILFGRFVIRWYLLRHTDYAITTQKVLRRRNRKVDILQGFSLPPFSIKEHKDGLKSISFGQSSLLRSSFSSNNRRNSVWDPGFCLEYLADGERALYAINAMRTGIAHQ